ncbi:MAG: ABC transporter substrate-binding protein [Oscillospiraceae bacterium]|nr:ABC transporter substrate-binding protein [Oscillospiraceae bacterium]
MNIRTAVYPRQLDPLREIGTWRYLWTTCVYENALTRDANNNIVPAVCDFELSEDQLELKLWVRDNVLFHNGDAVDIYDVEASIKRALAMYSSIKTFVAPYVESIKVDGDVLTITFTEFKAKCLYYLAGYQTWTAIMPKEICEKYADDYITDQIEDAIGTGPYKWAAYTANEFCTIERFDDYVPFENDYTGIAKTKRAYLDSITFTYVSADDAAALAALSGDLDMTEVMPTDYMELAEQSGLTKVSLNSDNGLAMIFNTKGTSNVCAKYPDLRKAIMAAIDYEAFLEIVTDSSHIMNANPALDPIYDTDIFNSADYYGDADMEVVNKYLDDAKAAGYNDEPVQLVLSNSRTDIANLLTSYLDDAGINYILTMKEEASASEFYGDPANNWDFYFTWPAFAFIPTNLSASLTTNNYENPAKDALMAEMETLSPTSEEYIAKWYELAQMMVDDCATAYMGRIYWFWFQPAEFHTNDEDSLIRYFFNAYWDDPENHMA